MDLSDRDRRMLGEIEQELRRRDRGFARRMDGLNAACGRARAYRFASHTTRWELVCVLIVVLVLSTLPMLMVLAAGRAASPPAHTPGVTRTE